MPLSSNIDDPAMVEPPVALKVTVSAAAVLGPAIHDCILEPAGVSWSLVASLQVKPCVSVGAIVQVVVTVQAIDTTIVLPARVLAAVAIVTVLLAVVCWRMVGALLNIRKAELAI